MLEGLTPTAEIENRIQALQRHLCNDGIDGALILQNSDLFYFAGTIQQSYLYVPAQGSPILMAKKNLARARNESPIGRVVAAKHIRQIPDLLRENGWSIPEKLGLESDVVPANLYFTCRDIFRRTSIVDVSHGIRMIRAIKSPYEIDMIRRASNMANAAAGSVKDLIEADMTEIEFAGRLEAVARKLGHQGIIRMRTWGAEMFYGHVMAGPSAAVPSYLASPTGGPGVGPAVAQGPGFRTIQPGEPILVDYVFAYNGYLADQTRIFALKDLPQRLLTGHQAMLQMQDLLVTSAKPGVKVCSLYEMALRFAEDHGYGNTFMGGAEQGVRFIGHGIGIEVDEYPVIAHKQEMRLEAGMVIALEPKLIFPGVGVVGIENTHLVTHQGLQRLTSFPDAVQIL